MLVFIVLLAGIFWCHRFGRAIWRFFKFWEIRSFFKEVLDITPVRNFSKIELVACFFLQAELRNFGWRDVLQRMKDAQKEFKMNIQKHELTELGSTPSFSFCSFLLIGWFNSCVYIVSCPDVYHRMLRFKNYMIAMVNKDVLPTKLPIPLYEEM